MEDIKELQELIREETLEIQKCQDEKQAIQNSIDYHISEVNRYRKRIEQLNPTKP